MQDYLNYLIQVYEGTLITVTAKFTDLLGNLVDPTTVTLDFAAGDNPLYYPVTTWTYQGTGSINRTGIGVYTAALDTTSQPGVWNVVWEGVGACQVTMRALFNVLATPF